MIFGHNFLQNHQNVKSLGCFGKSGNLQQDGHKIFWNWWKNVWDNWCQSWQPSKFNKQQMSHFEPTLKSSIFPGLYFEKICSFSKPKRVKNRTYLTVKRAQKQQENSIQCLSYMLPKFASCFATPCSILSSSTFYLEITY